MLAGVSGPRWTQAEIESARPDVLDAARWVRYAQRIWPPDLEAELNAPENPTPTQVRQTKVRLRTTLRLLRKQLLPPDEVSDGV